jgi:hypothetical protein
MPHHASNAACTDPIVGAILAGWRYDISSISPEMRTDYEQHLIECAHCRRRQAAARTIDVLLISVSSLSILAFLLAAVVIRLSPELVGMDAANQRHLELLTHISSVHLHLRQTPITISLEAVALAGLVISVVLWMLVAMATPLPGIVSGAVQQRIPPVLRQRIARRHA